LQLAAAQKHVRFRNFSVDVGGEGQSLSEERKKALQHIVEGIHLFADLQYRLL